jgi:hypothetical protein
VRIDAVSNFVTREPYPCESRTPSSRSQFVQKMSSLRASHPQRFHSIHRLPFRYAAHTRPGGRPAQQQECPKHVILDELPRHQPDHPHQRPPRGLRGTLCVQLRVYVCECVRVCLCVYICALCDVHCEVYESSKPFDTPSKVDGCLHRNETFYYTQCALLRLFLYRMFYLVCFKKFVISGVCQMPIAICLCVCVRV